MEEIVEGTVEEIVEGTVEEIVEGTVEEIGDSGGVSGGVSRSHRH